MSSNCVLLLFFFFHQSVNQGGDQELENLVTKLAVLKELLSSIEKKVHVMCRHVQTHTHNPVSSLHLSLSVFGCIPTCTHTDTHSC